MIKAKSINHDPSEPSKDQDLEPFYRKLKYLFIHKG